MIDCYLKIWEQALAPLSCAEVTEIGHCIDSLNPPAHLTGLNTDFGQK
jgi:hypothetical protein